MQAWELLRSRPFDLLVSDVNMPEMSGSISPRRCARTGCCDTAR
jgi:CheY-like chemotaxis protein